MAYYVLIDLDGWFCGKIVKVNKPSKSGEKPTYDISFTDGDKASKVLKSEIRLHEWDTEDETPRNSNPPIYNVEAYACQVDKCGDDGRHQCQQDDCAVVVCSRHEQHTFHNGLPMRDLIKNTHRTSTVTISMGPGSALMMGQAQVTGSATLVSQTGCKRSPIEPSHSDEPALKKSKRSAPASNSSGHSSDEEMDGNLSSEEDEELSRILNDEDEESDSNESGEIGVISNQPRRKMSRKKHQGESKSKVSKKKKGLRRREIELVGVVNSTSPAWIGFMKYSAKGADPSDTYNDKGSIVQRSYEHYAVCCNCYDKAARKYLCVPASSAAVERLFSHAGKTIADDRAKLDPYYASELIFLRVAWEKIEECEAKGLLISKETL